MVSWLFLACGVFGAAWTLVSFKPPQRPPLLMMVGFFAAWSTTELAPIHLLWQILATGVFVALGALHAWPGWAGLGITLVSWAGLAASTRGALQTDRRFKEQLASVLGIDPSSLDRARIERTRLLLPFHFKRRGVRRVRNIQYVDDGTKRHRLDVYHRADLAPNAGAPVLLQIHGGGWMIGEKHQQALPLMYHLAARGWVCIAINYRLSPKATWPDHLVDCKRALAWIREHVAEYGGDPEFVVATGGSAGGHLTAMMGLTANDPAYQPGFEDVDTSVRGMVPFYGVYDWTGAFTSKRHGDGLRDILERYIVKQPYADAPEVYAAASPINHVNADAPPALVVHGDLDTLAPIEQARAFATRLRDTSSQPVVYVELPGAHHAFEVFNSIRTLHSVAGVEVFLQWLVNARGAAPRRHAPPRDDRGQTGVAAASEPANGQRSTARTEQRPDSPARATPGRS
jgi:acetyl esterase/lipase